MAGTGARVMAVAWDSASKHSEVWDYSHLMALKKDFF